jgi:hypothetical protein
MHVLAATGVAGVAWRGCSRSELFGLLLALNSTSEVMMWLSNMAGLQLTFQFALRGVCVPVGQHASLEHFRPANQAQVMS